MNVRKLLTDAQNLALDADKPISAALRMMLVLGSVPELAEVREWALRELKGYEGTPLDQLPAYRRVGSSLTGTLFDGFRKISNTPVTLSIPSPFSDDARKKLELRASTVSFWNPVAELEALCTSAQLQGPVRQSLPAEILPHVHSLLFDMPCIEAYHPITAPLFARVLDAVRTATVEFTSGALAAIPVSTDETQASLQQAQAAITQHFHHCVFGATSTSLMPITRAHSVTANTTATNHGIVGIENTLSDTVPLESVANDLRLLTGAVAVLSHTTNESTRNLLQAITEFQARALEQGQHTQMKVDELIAMLDPIWLKFMGESFKTWGQRMLETHAGKLLGAMPALAKLLPGAS